MQKVRFVFVDGREETCEIEDPAEVFTFPREEIPTGVTYIDVMPDYFNAAAGTEGFLLIPSIEGSHYSSLTFFRPREDCEEIFPDSSMSFYACRRGRRAALAIVTGM